MKEISVKGYGLSTMCRLCLTSNVTVLNLFEYLTGIEYKVSEIVMKCAPVQIMSYDEMPHFICQSCFTQLENYHQFQKQIVKSDKTLRRYLQQLRGYDKQIKTECSIQEPSEDPLIQNTNPNTIVKCESLERRDVFDMDVDLKEEIPSNYSSADKLYLKCDIKEEPIDDISSIPTEWTDNLNKTLSEDHVLDMDVDLKDESFSNKTSAEDISGEMFLKIEIKDEPINDNSIPTEWTDNLNENGGGKSRFEKSENLIRIGSARLKKCVVNREYEHKNTSEKSNRHKKISYQCDVRYKHFPFLGIFNIHKRTHTGEKPYKCDVCSKSFSISTHLRQHIRTHTGEKPYKCEVCGKSFSQSGRLKIHKRTHSGEKPYKCDVCDKSFSESSHVTLHKRTHTGEKPYECDVCSKSCSVSCNLIRHKRTHIGEKPYKCEVCSKRFTQSTNLNIHKRKHTGEKPYECDVCHRHFTQSMHLIVHKCTQPYWSKMNN